MITFFVFVLVIAASFSGVISARPGEEDVPIWAKWIEPLMEQRRQGFLNIPMWGSEENVEPENRWQQFGNQWQQSNNQWQQPFNQFGQNQRPGQFGQNQRPGQFGQNQRPGQFGQNQRPGQFGQNQRPGQFGQNQRPGQFGQNQRPGQFGQNQRPGQFGQNQRPGQFEQNQRPDQFEQNQRPDQFEQTQRPDQFGQNQRPDQFEQTQRPDQFGQNQRPDQFGQNQRPDQFGQNQRPDQFGQNQRPDQFGQTQRPNQSGQSQRPSQRPNEQENGESNQFGQGSQQGGQKLRPGDSCTRDNRVGICTRIYNCQEVVQGIQQNRPPPRPCYVPPNEAVPYVCCLDKAGDTTPKPTSKPTSPRPTQVRERLAKRKCSEYADYAFEIRESPALVEGPAIKVDRCVKSAEELIVGGKEATLGEFPHMALLGYGADPESLSYDCGGSLISEDFVLTAAHCIAEKTPSYVLLGELILRDETDHAQPQLIPISADRGIIPHPDYRYPSHYNDIALIRLGGRPQLGPEVRPACLHTGNSYRVGSLIASGWGRLDFGGDPSDILMKVNLNDVAYETCNKTYRNMGNKLTNGIRSDQQICAGRLEGGKDTCQGDSGGPLQVFRSEPHCTYDIVGVVSFGKGCALRNTPGVYARVKHYVDWIEQIVWPGLS